MLCMLNIFDATMRLAMEPSLIGEGYLFIFIVALHKTFDKYFSLIILGYYKCIL